MGTVAGSLTFVHVNHDNVLKDTSLHQQRPEPHHVIVLVVVMCVVLRLDEGLGPVSPFREVRLEHEIDHPASQDQALQAKNCAPSTSHRHIAQECAFDADGR